MSAEHRPFAKRENLGAPPRFPVWPEPEPTLEEDWQALEDAGYVAPYDACTIHLSRGATTVPPWNSLGDSDSRGSRFSRAWGPRFQNVSGGRRA